MKKEEFKKNLIHARFSGDHASHLTELASADLAEARRVFLDPVTLSFKLESGTVTYDEP